VHKGEEEMELDLIGTSNGENRTVVTAEVKSVLNQRELEKLIRNLRRFFEFFPQFRGSKLYGVLAAVHSSREMDAATLAHGIALARMHGDIFRLAVPQETIVRPTAVNRDFRNPWCLGSRLPTAEAA
jgi:hypothetical protein